MDGMTRRFFFQEYEGILLAKTAAVEFANCVVHLDFGFETNKGKAGWNETICLVHRAT